MSSLLLDNNPTLNICPLATTIALCFSPSNFKPSTQTVELMMGLRGLLWVHLLHTL